MKLRIALGLAGVLLLAALVGLPGSNQATAQDANYEIVFANEDATLDKSTDIGIPAFEEVQGGVRGTAHIENGPFKCKIVRFVAPGGLVACKSIQIFMPDGTVLTRHIAAVEGRRIIVD